MTYNHPKEKDIFIEHYSEMCNTMLDIDYLLPHFLTQQIISVDDFTEITVKPRKTDKVDKLLQYIYGSLQAGSVNSFYTMLSIMERHGTQATRKLASRMRSLVTTRRG